MSESTLVPGVGCLQMSGAKRPLLAYPAELIVTLLHLLIFDYDCLMSEHL